MVKMSPLIHEWKKRGLRTEEEIRRGQQVELITILFNQLLPISS